MTLLECFSQSKNELMLGFGDNNDDLWIKADLKSEFTSLCFPKRFERAKKNSVNLFSDFLNQKVISVSTIPFDRSFTINFEKDRNLLFKMHGSRSNIISINNQVDKIFRGSLLLDWNVTIQGLAKNIEWNKHYFMTHEADAKKAFPFLGKEIMRELNIHNYEELSDSKKWNLLDGLYQEISKGQFYISDIDGKIEFLLFPTRNILLKNHNPIEAVTKFYYAYQRNTAFRLEKNKIQLFLDKSIKSTNSYISEGYKKMKLLATDENYKHLADILMANLHQISTGTREAESYDFYQDKKVKVNIKRGMSPQKQAESYYRKNKNQKIEKSKLAENISNKEIKLEQLLKWKEKLNNAEYLKEIRDISAEILPIAKANQEALPFKKFHIDGFEIWVGKNAKNNDLLTLKYAKKDDLWLHAKDVRGSHTVIKNKPGKIIPKPVIEKAAQLAAYYSKGKNDTLFPVICTPKKFVRKPKGFSPGMVRVEKENILMVKPKLTMD